MDFSDLIAKVLVAYGDGSYREALDLVQEARPRFPDRDSTVTRFEACLLSLAGEPQQALDVLEAGLERGLFWHPRMLLDPDLDAARKLDGWAGFEARSAA